MSFLSIEKYHTSHSILKKLHVRIDKLKTLMKKMLKIEV